MAEDEGRENEGTEETEEDESGSEGAEDEGTEGTEDEDPATLRKDRDAAIRRRDRALAAKRKAEAELAELRKGKDKDGEEPDPVEVANAKIVRQSVRTALATAGVPKDDHADVLGLLNLSGISVDKDGDPDEDAIEDAITVLQRVFGGTANGRRTSRPRTDARDKGGKGGTSDPDSDRYRRILGQR